MKKIKGITLISLVITIIIMIILAGVTINMTIGPNGILKRAKQAKEDFLVAANIEQEALRNAELALGGSIKNDEDEFIGTTENLKEAMYVKYDTGIETIGDNGVITCRVLYEVNSEYGLQIISEDTIGTVGFTTNLNNTGPEMKSIYNNQLEKLNKVAEQYINEDYAIDARCVGSVPDFENKNTGSSSYKSLPSGFSTPSSWR